MRLVYLALLLSISVLNPQPGYSQQLSPSAPNPSALLQRSLAALVGSQTVTDVTLSGTVRRIAGSLDESGTVTVKALASTGARIDLNLPSGTRREIRNISSGPAAGSWSGPDGVPHAISSHNLFTDPGWFLASQQDPQSSTTPVTAIKDPQAISAATQALNAAGGMPAISAIEDYTATGAVTYYVLNNLSSSVTIRESGLTQLRIDAELPTGTRSQAINGGQITFREGGAPSTAFEQVPIYPGCIVLPNLFLAVASIGSDFSLTYKGTVQVDGRTTYDLQIQRVLPDPGLIKHPEILTTDVFIEATTFQAVMMQDSNSRREIRQIRYSDYRPLNGVLVPFTISERIGSNQTWTVQVSQISLNTGLQDSDFQL